MDPIEYKKLAAVERVHWYYRGKRELVKYWIKKFIKLQKEDKVLDCGAGTGCFAEELKPECDMFVLDDHAESLDVLKTKFDAAHVIELKEPRLPIATGSLTALTALDVLEHIEHDVSAVSEFSRVVKSGGIVVVTVPAMMCLWSQWDVGLHHYRRYNRAQLRSLFGTNGWDILHCNYTNVAVFPLVWTIRKFQRKGSSESRAEDKVPCSWLNSLLFKLFVGLGKVKIPFPFGVSLILVARRK